MVNRWEAVFILTWLGIIASFCWMCFTIFDQQKTIDGLEDKIARFDMYYDEKYKQQFNNGTINGLAFGHFISVWTEGRTITQTLETCTHEYAHNNLRLVDK